MTKIQLHAGNASLLTLKVDVNEALTEVITLCRATGRADATPYSAFRTTHWFEKSL